MGQEKRGQQLKERDGGMFEWLALAVDREQGRMASAGWKDRLRRRHVRRGSEEDRRMERKQDGWRGNEKEGKGQGRKERNEGGDVVRGRLGKVERAGRWVIRENELG